MAIYQLILPTLFCKALLEGSEAMVDTLGPATVIANESSFSQAAIERLGREPHACQANNG